MVSIIQQQSFCSNVPNQATLCQPLSMFFKNYVKLMLLCVLVTLLVYNVLHKYSKYQKRSRETKSHINPIKPKYEEKSSYRPRILCWIMTYPKNHAVKARAVLETWGKRCDKLLFMSSETVANSTQFIALNVQEGRQYLWDKTRAAMEYLYDNYLYDYDWFLKADDDSFVIVENLRHLVSFYKNSDPIYFGCRYKPFVTQGYMSGGAGYVMSREATRRFIENGVRNASNAGRCGPKWDRAEDVMLGQCMQVVHIDAKDSRDALARHKFFPFEPQFFLNKDSVNRVAWFWRYIKDPVELGENCCSDRSISFHYVSPNEMRLFEFLIYTLRHDDVGETIVGGANVGAANVAGPRVGDALRAGGVNVVRGM